MSTGKKWYVYMTGDRARAYQREVGIPDDNGIGCAVLDRDYQRDLIRLMPGAAAVDPVAIDHDDFLAAARRALIAEELLHQLMMGRSDILFSDTAYREALIRIKSLFQKSLPPEGTEAETPPSDDVAGWTPENN